MDKSWSLERLTNLVPVMNGNYHKIIGILESLGSLFHIYNYHNETANNARKKLNCIVDEKSPDLRSYLRYLFNGVSRDEQIEFHLIRIEIRANIISLIGVTRSMYELLALLINYMVLNGEIKEKYCDIHKVIKALPDSEIKSKLSEIVGSNWFLYISHFSNLYKHRYLVKESFGVDMENSTAGSSFEAFEFEVMNNKFNHQKYYATDILKGVLDIKNRIVSVGILLNQELEK